MLDSFDTLISLIYWYRNILYSFFYIYIHTILTDGNLNFKFWIFLFYL